MDIFWRHGGRYKVSVWKYLFTSFSWLMGTKKPRALNCRSTFSFCFRHAGAQRSDDECLVGLEQFGDRKRCSLYHRVSTLDRYIALIEVKVQECGWCCAVVRFVQVQVRVCAFACTSSCRWDHSIHLHHRLHATSCCSKKYGYCLAVVRKTRSFLPCATIDQGS